MSVPSLPPLPNAVLVAGISDAVWLDAEDGTLDRIPIAEAARRARKEPPLLCHLPATSRRLRCDSFPCFDLLELYAFVRPAKFCVPTAAGLSAAMGLPLPDTLEDAALSLLRVRDALLADLKREAGRKEPSLPRIATAMARGLWSWGPAVLSVIGVEDDGLRAATSGLDVWRRLPEWQEQAPPPPPAGYGVDPRDTRRRLAELLGEGAEDRPSQGDYAAAVTHAFQPRLEDGSPNAVLAEAGTGVGKTLGYIAPASLWSERNEAPVWLSTYTRNLQHQIDSEVERLFPDEKIRRKKVVIRKGRENYLCLLNLEEAVRGTGVNKADAVPLGLMARWTLATRDGDMTGGDFPSWLSDLLGVRRSTGLTDRRGECIFSACAHYSRCFIEHSQRRAKRADLVIANHALVMIQAARGLLEQQNRVTRLVFDEGHHVFDAADNAFSAHLSGLETTELRRWIRGAETRGSGRARGLKNRLDDLLSGDDAFQALDALMSGAAALPGGGWRERCSEGRPSGPAEAFLSQLRSLVYARSSGRDGGYDLEAPVDQPPADLIEAAAVLYEALDRIEQPAKRLVKSLARRLDEEADELDTTTRTRIEAITRSLQYRCIDLVRAWGDMLQALQQGVPEAFVDWASVDRSDGREYDTGLHRHWIDPTRPFAEVVMGPAHGVVITSATLTDRQAEKPDSADPADADASAGWLSAEQRTGTRHLPNPAFRAKVDSPFDYPALTKVLIVNDVRRDDADQVAAAYRELIGASGGGAIGLFTSIARLRGVYRRIAAPLAERGLPLLAQHVDNLNLASLVDIFRAEHETSLLGTDALRDGVDVPGASLRLIVFDRVPWPRPTLLHKARRGEFGGNAYDDQVTRLRLKQAFGRLVRRADDRGVFVMLDSRTPSRLLNAFPPGVSVERVGLAEAVQTVVGFLTRQTVAALDGSNPDGP
ncbi:MAG: ATP-dependent DNA helicase [Alphaproteobacteria bacterium]